MGVQSVRIIHRKDGMYDAYDRMSGKWIFSFHSPDNVFDWLSKKNLVQIDFIDEYVLGGE